MIEFWAVIGLSTIDHVFYEGISEASVNDDFERVRRILSEYNFRLSRYEAAEVIRVFRLRSVREGIVAVQGGIWENNGGGGDDTPCWTGSSITGFDKPDRTYLQPFVQLSNGKDEIAFSSLVELHKDPLP